MTTWAGDGVGDLVGNAAKDVIAAILNRASKKEEKEEKLQTAQKTLVQQVCEKYWPDGLRELLWVQSVRRD